jgi:hypothetical protein
MGIILGTTLTPEDLERRVYAEQRRNDDADTGPAAQCTSAPLESRAVPRAT